MDGLISVFLNLIFILNLNGLVIDYNINGTEKIYSLVPDKFMKDKMSKAFFPDRNYGEDKNEIKFQFQEKVVIQNNCEYENFYEDICPSIGSFKDVVIFTRGDGNYIIVQGCLADFNNSNIETNFTWIVTNSANVNIIELASGIDSAKYHLYNKTMSCNEVCLKICPGKELIYEFKDFLIFFFLILFFIGFLIFYKALDIWRKFKTLNQVEDFPQL